MAYQEVGTHMLAELISFWRITPFQVCDIASGAATGDTW